MHMIVLLEINVGRRFVKEMRIHFFSAEKEMSQ